MEIITCTICELAKEQNYIVLDTTQMVIHQINRLNFTINIDTLLVDYQ